MNYVFFFANSSFFLFVCPISNYIRVFLFYFQSNQNGKSNQKNIFLVLMLYESCVAHGLVLFSSSYIISISPWIYCEY